MEDDIELLSKYKKKIERISRETGVVIPDKYFVCAPATCWKCDKEILVFSWPNHSDNEQIAPIIEPIPSTIKYQFSKTAEEKYWINTCPYCQSNQGDFYLYSEPDGPFFALELSTENKGSIENELLKIAKHLRSNELL